MRRETRDAVRSWIVEGDDPKTAKGNVTNAMTARNVKAAKADDPTAREGKFVLSVKLTDDQKSILVTLKPKPKTVEANR